MDEAAPTRLLLVDDEAALREPLAEYLSRQGFAVRQAANAAEARSRLREEMPDLVLLDIMMPGEDGLSLCRHLVEALKLPVIFITAKGESTDRIVGLEIGADDYVVKPFDPRELALRVDAILRRLLMLGREGGEHFFGEPALQLAGPAILQRLEQDLRGLFLYDRDPRHALLVQNRVLSGLEADTRMEVGSGAHALIEASRGGQMLVVGSRGHGGFVGMLLGSVSAACTHHAHCPVVVVRPEASKAA